MKKTAFLAHPITDASDPDRLGLALDAVRSRLVNAGWTVRPKTGAGDRKVEILDSATNAATFQGNVSGIENSDILVVVAWPSSTPTSIWLEVGVALGAKVPVLIADNGAALPFLIRLAKESDPGCTGIRVLDIGSLIEGEDGLAGLAGLVAEACDRYAPNQPGPQL